MKILQVTNIISHHQLPLARELVSRMGEDNFRFATTEPVDAERARMGWDSQVDASWILLAGESESARKQYEEWWDNADVVICGIRQLDRILDRINSKKNTFYMSERWWKPPVGRLRLLHPRFAFMTRQFGTLATSKYFHYLPISDYAAADMTRIAKFHGRCWRWGYFTSLPVPMPEIRHDSTSLKVLWAGRFLGWKRVDTLIKAFSRLLQQYPDSTLTLVGNGEARAKLERLAVRILPEGTFQFFNSVPAAEVVNLMARHHIYVLPSNYYEGWGAVINESMSAGCTVLGSRATGAAKSLILDQKNGLLFDAGDWHHLGALLIEVAQNPEKRIRLARAAQQTMVDTWSPAVAADRLLSISEALVTHATPPIYASGPMASL